MHKARLSLNRIHEVLARERRQNEESQYYEEQKECMVQLIEGRNWIFFYVALNVIQLQTRFSRNHIFEIAVVQNFRTNNLIDLKFDMHVWTKYRCCMN